MRFLAIEHELPSDHVTNDMVVTQVREHSSRHLSPPDLDRLVTLLDSCFATAGTTVRRHRAPGEHAADLAVRAGRRALATAGIDPGQIDLLIYVGIGRGVLEPASATIYQDLLGLHRATAFDVLDACASWARALHLAHLFLAAGTYRRIMILNAEFVGRDAHRYELRTVDEFAHWHPSMTIGEAATATIVATSDDPVGFAADFRTQGQFRDLCFVPMPNMTGYFGKHVQVEPTPEPLQFVSFGLRLMSTGARQLVEHYHERPQFHSPAPDAVLTHSASDGMSEFVVRQCGLDRSRVHLFHHRFANTVSASLPLGMSHLVKEGVLRPGDNVLLLTASAGVTTGLTRFTYLT